MRARSASVVALCLWASASVGAGPRESRSGSLTVKLSAQCATVQVVRADVYLDGDFVGSVSPGDWSVNYVDVGRHIVEGASYDRDGQVANKWGPRTVFVAHNGETTFLSCGWPSDPVR